MAGHNKWTQIKRQKEVTDAKKSKTFGKLARAIGVAAKISGGKETPELRAAIEKARRANAPKDIIERALKRANETKEMESVLYETYGPGGAGIIITALSDNKNRTTQEMKHLLSENGFSLGAPGSVVWAFRKKNNEWVPTSTILLSGEDLKLLEKLVDELEEHDAVQEVHTNVE
ncbi:MAG: YebC/PmpR family DNA-binding transcriptional regulator [Patescibacteria group bacterium]